MKKIKCLAMLSLLVANVALAAEQNYTMVVNETTEKKPVKIHYAICEHVYPILCGESKEEVIDPANSSSYIEIPLKANEFAVVIDAIELDNSNMISQGNYLIVPDSYQCGSSYQGYLVLNNHGTKKLACEQMYSNATADVT